MKSKHSFLLSHDFLLTNGTFRKYLRDNTYLKQISINDFLLFANFLFSTFAQ
jgi:hypothetical protein